MSAPRRDTRGDCDLLAVVYIAKFLLRTRSDPHDVRLLTRVKYAHLMFSLDSIRACSPAIDPSPHLLCSFLPRKKRQGPSVSGIPAPTYKVIVSDVVVELFKSAIAVWFRIFNLATEIGNGTSDKNHLVFGSGERPFGISGRHVFAGEICGLVASVATDGADAVAVFAAVDILHVDVTLPWSSGAKSTHWKGTKLNWTSLLVRGQP